MVALEDYDYEFESRVDSVRNAFQDGWIRWLQKAGPASHIAEIYQQCMSDLDEMRREGMRRLPALYRAQHNEADTDPDT